MSKKIDVIVVTKRVVFPVGTDLEKASAAAKTFEDADVTGGQIEETKLTLGKRDAG